jgi:hypothetical protein
MQMFEFLHLLDNILLLIKSVVSVQDVPFHSSVSAVVTPGPVVSTKS